MTLPLTSIQWPWPGYVMFICCSSDALTSCDFNGIHMVPYIGLFLWCPYDKLPNEVDGLPTNSPQHLQAMPSVWVAMHLYEWPCICTGACKINRTLGHLVLFDWAKHEFHEIHHSVTLYYMKKRLQTMLWHHNARVNSQQRWKQTRFRVCFHLCCELTLALWCPSIVWHLFLDKQTTKSQDLGPLICEVYI